MRRRPGGGRRLGGGMMPRQPQRKRGDIRRDARTADVMPVRRPVFRRQPPRVTQHQQRKKAANPCFHSRSRNSLWVHAIVPEQPKPSISNSSHDSQRQTDSALCGLIGKPERPRPNDKISLARHTLFERCCYAIVAASMPNTITLSRSAALAISIPPRAKPSSS